MLYDRYSSRITLVSDGLGVQFDWKDMKMILVCLLFRLVEIHSLLKFTGNRVCELHVSFTSQEESFTYI